MRPSRWYCPPGVPKPAHACIAGEMACMPTGGPPGAIPGGMCYGGPVEPGEAGWQQHPAGHWFNFTDASPALLLRMNPNPRLVRWVEIAGAAAEQVWRVPVLLEPVYDGETERILLFKTALDRVWTGTAWAPPDEMAELQRRLLLVNHGIGMQRMDLSSAEAVKVALDLLHLGHEFDDHEMIAAKWVSEVLVIRILIAAVGMELV
jgi:hypothetical protein